MNLESLVPTLDLCQQLKAAGFQQDTALVWAKLFQEPWLPPEVEQVMERLGRQEVHTDYILCAAPTAEEILKELPWALQPWLPQIEHVSLYVRKDPNGFQVVWRTINARHEIPVTDDDRHYEKESEAAALAYLWWKEQK
jgi:protoheme ferro-lyase